MFAIPRSALLAVAISALLVLSASATLTTTPDDSNPPTPAPFRRPINTNTGDGNIQVSGNAAAGGAAAGDRNPVSSIAGTGNSIRTSATTAGSDNNANVIFRMNQDCFPFCGGPTTNLNSGNANVQVSGIAAAGGAAAGTGNTLPSVAGTGRGNRVSTGTGGVGNNVGSDVGGTVNAACFPFCGSSRNSGNANVQVSGAFAAGGGAAGIGNSVSNIAGSSGVEGGDGRESTATTGTRNNVGSRVFMPSATNAPCFPFCDGRMPESTRDTNTGNAEVDVPGDRAAGGAAAGTGNSVSGIAGFGDGNRGSTATSGIGNTVDSMIELGPGVVGTGAPCFPFCGARRGPSETINSGDAIVRVSGANAVGGASAGSGNSVSNVAGQGNGERTSRATGGQGNNVGRRGLPGHRRLLRMG